MPRPTLRLALAAACVAAVAVSALAAAAAAERAPADRRLANALVVSRDDGLPRSWTRDEFNDDARGRCLSLSHRAVTARTRAGFGEENSGMWSVATVLKTRTQAARYYAAFNAALPRCLRRAVRHNPVDADLVGTPRAVSLRRLGDRSSGWRLRVTYGGNPFHYDWIVVRTRRAVLVDLFVVFANQRGAAAMEQGIVRRALRRAATAG